MNASATSAFRSLYTSWRRGLRGLPLDGARLARRALPTENHAAGFRPWDRGDRARVQFMDTLGDLLRPGGFGALIDFLVETLQQRSREGSACFRRKLERFLQ